MASEMRRQLIPKDDDDDDEQLLNPSPDGGGFGAGPPLPPPAYQSPSQCGYHQDYQQPTYPSGVYLPTPNQQPQHPVQQQQPSLQPQQQQQQQVMIIGSQVSPVIIQAPPGEHESYCGHIVTACVVFWLCNLPCGFIAFCLAVVANSTKRGDRKSARQLGNVSLCLSVSGIVITVVLVSVLVFLFFRGYFNFATAVERALVPCPYTVNGACYQTRRLITSCVGDDLGFKNLIGVCCTTGEYYSGQYCYRAT